MNERPMRLGGSRSLVGIASFPEDGRVDSSRPALIAVNAGHVHRVGPHRLHVTLNRRMAARGFVALRFDFSGIGDSPQRSDSLPFERSAVLELREVMDDLGRIAGIDKFCIAGLSSGGLVSVMCANADPRVVGACMMNPHGFVETKEWDEHIEKLSVARIYARNALQLGSWRKLLTGKTNYRRLGRTLWYRFAHGRNREAIAPAADQVSPQLVKLLEQDVELLMLLSEKDFSIANLNEILGPRWRQRVGPNVQVAVLPDANHTIARPADQREAVDTIERWMLRCWPGRADADAVAAARAPASRVASRQTGDSR